MQRIRSYLALLLFAALAVGCTGIGQEWLGQDGKSLADSFIEVSGELESGDVTEGSDAALPDGAENDVCVPDCEGKECGNDGCGGNCGTCPAVAPICGDNGKCAVECIPDCTDKECGDDGCGGGPCGECPEVAPYCVEFKCAMECDQQCDGKECGDDGCGGDCGPCPDGTPDCVDGICTFLCEPECGDKECGDDGCGGDCGQCDCGETCTNGMCQWVGCGDKMCGEDGCGDSCGLCPAGATCTDSGYCVTQCELNCKDKQCGSDGCGGWCGQCPDEKICNDWGQCVTDCDPDCQSKECGPDGCGGSCGNCFFPGSGDYCVAGHCVAECEADCGLKACGDDGCGESCGECPGELLCTAGGMCGGFCTQCTYADDCYELDFGDGSLTSWSVDSISLVSAVGGSEAPSGGYMLKLTTGEGITELESQATFQNCLPKGDYMVGIRWRFYSEEFKEWCGSNFQDSMQVKIGTSAENTTVLDYVVDDLCPPEDCIGCGSAYQGLNQSDIALDQGDVWDTGWRETWVPLVLPTGDDIFDVTFYLTDAGDGIYDSLLLVDHLRFLPCEQACETIECGENPCGTPCGECDDGAVCVDGKCCVASCAGKECGNDGCGGNCGTCGSLSGCSDDGECVCTNEECNDGCCAAGDVCSALSGKCCQPSCFFAPCQPDGCGGICPGMGGQVCCTAASDCDDDDDCTQDDCINGLCQWDPLGGPACCEPFDWERDFDDGTNQGFVIDNSGGGGLPGLDIGWGVSNACGSHSQPFALYYGAAAGMLGNCIYDMAFPFPMPTSGTATSPAITLPDSQAIQLNFWIVTDIQAGSNVDALSLSVLKGQQATVVWDKSDISWSLGDTWHKVPFSLSDFAGEEIRLRWSFDTMGTQGDGNKKGVLLDDISISSVCAP